MEASRKRPVKKLVKKEAPKRKILVDFGAPSPPTAKQMDFIRDIECYTSIEFIGETFEEASAFISANIELYQEMKFYDLLEDEANDFSMGGYYDF